jgi:hypothetical protein
MIQERDAEKNGSADSSNYEVEPFKVTVVGANGSRDTSQRNGSLEQALGNMATTPSLAESKLKWRRADLPEVSQTLTGEDESGVTICALPGDDRYKDELEEGEIVDKLDDTIPFSRDQNCSLCREKLALEPPVL